LISTDRAGRDYVRVPAGEWAATLVPTETNTYWGDSVDTFAKTLDSLPSGILAFLFADNTIRCTSRMLQLLERGIAFVLLDPQLAESTINRLIDIYRPGLVLLPEEGVAGRCLSGRSGHLSDSGHWIAVEHGPAVHPDLAVLLTTSGTTGNPKLVRLSTSNIRTNAKQIVASLGITPEDRAVTALPSFYSFGLSIITSHVIAGSPIVVSGRGVLEKEFWSALREFDVSFMAGVPRTYSMLKRLGFDQMDLPRLRALTQAGGRLDPEAVSTFHRIMCERGGQFFVMYGQTEASPRMACLPSDDLPEKSGSVGPALSGGRLEIVGADGSPQASGGIGEVAYTGPNVMMGYAESREDLALGDVHGPDLLTGDLGYLDRDGYLFLTGRIKRITKLAGVRMSLDDIESLATSMANCPTVAVDGGNDDVCIFVESRDMGVPSRIRRGLANALRVPPGLLDIRTTPTLPVLNSGKVDYADLSRRAEKK
jgi:acyl-CoA synthetase (AMP-forming)/AMP-acid ligase II